MAVRASSVYGDKNRVKDPCALLSLCNETNVESADLGGIWSSSYPGGAYKPKQELQKEEKGYFCSPPRKKATSKVKWPR